MWRQNIPGVPDPICKTEIEKRGAAATKQAANIWEVEDADKKKRKRNHSKAAAAAAAALSEYIVSKKHILLCMFKTVGVEGRALGHFS